MLKARINVDLPSRETERGKGVFEWVRSLFGAKLDLRSGYEALTVSALSLVEGIVEAFQSATVNDVISLVIDGRVVYIDKEDVKNDLRLMHKAAVDSRVLEKPFRELHLALSHHEAGLHVLIDVQIKSQVLLGEEEMKIRLSGRLEALRVQPGESAEAYAQRVRGIAAADQALEPYRLVLSAFAERLGAQLRKNLVGAKVTVEPGWVEIVRPDEREIGRFRQLEFGSRVEPATYRPQPLQSQRGAYGDPYYYYYNDPYHFLTTFLLLDALSHSHAVWPNTHVVSPAGEHLATGENIDEAVSGWGGSDVVSIDEGGVQVDPSVPDWGGSDVGGGDWGGSDVGGGDWGGSDVGDAATADFGDGGGMDFFDFDFGGFD